MKRIIIFSALLFVLAIAFFLMDFMRPLADKNKNYISINGHSFEAESVSQPADLERGLSGRPGLCEKCAMLFIFDKAGRHSFWMKDMRFNLDIIWILGEKVVFVERNVPYQEGAKEIANPPVDADKVLEINAGLSDELGIKIGNTVSF